MELGGIPVVDTRQILAYYQERGLSTDLIKKCNAQEFRFINGYGEGFFLSIASLSGTTALVWDGRTVNLNIIDQISIDHPSVSGVYCYHTAEPKYELLAHKVGRNYNIILDKTIPPSGAVTALTLPPDNITKSLQQIVTDFLPVGMSLAYSATLITPYNVNIEGLSVLRALDYLCSVYGLLWSFDNNIVYIHDVNGATSVAKRLPDPINDIRHTPDSTPNYNVTFPIYDYCRQDPSEYYTYEQDNLSEETVNLFVPFSFAVATTSGTIRNSTALNAVAQLVIDNVEGLRNLNYYTVKHFPYASALSVEPRSISEIHGDFGSGPRSIYRDIEYPYHRPHKPRTHHRYADNWIGTITDGFVEAIANFTVSPLYGLDGKIPFGNQAVYNLYNWTYAEPGWIIRIEWDCVNNQWIPLMMEFECPPDPLPPPPEVTPPSTPYFPE